MQSGSRLDVYLADIERRLKPLSPAERDEELREVRLHLEALRDTLMQQNDADPEGATIRQFGTAGEVAGKIRAAWRRGHRGAFRSAFFYSMGLWGCCAYQVWIAVDLLGMFYDPPYALWQGRTEMRHGSEFVHTGIIFSILLLCLLGTGILCGRIFRGTMAARGAAWGFVALLAFEVVSSFNQLSMMMQATFASDALSLLPRLFLVLPAVAIAIALGTFLGSRLRPLSLKPFSFWPVLIRYMAAVSAVGTVSWAPYLIAQHQHYQWFSHGQIGNIPWAQMLSFFPHVAGNLVAGVLVGRRAGRSPSKLVLAAAVIAGLNYVSIWFMFAGQDLRFWDSNPSFVIGSFQRLGYNLAPVLVLSLVTAAASVLAFRHSHHRRMTSP